MSDYTNLLDLLDEAAACRGEATAFCGEDGSFTWGQMRAAAQSAGTALLAAGAEGRPVLLYFGRGAACAPAMFGVLAAGGFYTVLDPAQPADRMCAIAARLKPAAVVADAEHAAAAATLNVAPVFCWEEICTTAPDAAQLAAVRRRATDEDLAYVLFTSGSTGEPKGVAVRHRNVLAYSAWAVRAFHFDETTVFGNQTPFYFSMSVTDIFCALRAAARVEVLPKRLFSFPVQLLEKLVGAGVNTLYWVPSALSIVANWKALDYTAPPALSMILFAGEVMPTARLNYWRAHYPNAVFANLYGPTETTDICAYYVLDRAFADDEALPIGRACENCGLLVLKSDGQGGATAAAPGEEGELCARGSFLAAGYYGMPEKTAERFVQNPLCQAYPEVIYRTGDLVRENARGELCYCGRADDQIKHMGYRIEPGEVETAAAGQEKLEGCACLYDAPRDRLILFYQAKRDLNDALRQRLAQKLPTYMRPAVYSRVKQLPHNQNGKVDRRALAAQMAELKEL